jgi:hypothetical protein
MINASSPSPGSLDKRRCICRMILRQFEPRIHTTVAAQQQSSFFQDNVLHQLVPGISLLPELSIADVECFETIS